MATISSVLGSSAATADQATASSSSGGLEQTANKETFLKLLVAQIKNQDPLNPADGTEFLTQLAQFSQLEQLINIRSGIEGLSGQLSQTSTKSEGETASETQSAA
jgi:flagellar basal-body rod modification protein FlgD